MVLPIPWGYALASLLWLVRSVVLYQLVQCRCLLMLLYENAFRITGPLWGESADDRWIPLTKASNPDNWWMCNYKYELVWKNILCGRKFKLITYALLDKIKSWITIVEFDFADLPIIWLILRQFKGHFVCESRGIHRWPVDSPNTGPVKRSVDGCGIMKYD